MVRMIKELAPIGIQLPHQVLPVMVVDRVKSPRIVNDPDKALVEVVGGLVELGLFLEDSLALAVIEMFLQDWACGIVLADALELGW